MERARWLLVVFNAINKTEAHFTYPIDYTVTIPITGGAQLQFIASDTNCSEVRNCNTTSIDGVPGVGTCFPTTLANLSDPRIIQPFNGQFVIFNLVSVTP